jgi:hypothetical protein
MKDFDELIRKARKQEGQAGSLQPDLASGGKRASNAARSRDVPVMKT